MPSRTRCRLKVELHFVEERLFDFRGRVLEYPSERDFTIPDLILVCQTFPQTPCSFVEHRFPSHFRCGTLRQTGGDVSPKQRMLKIATLAYQSFSHIGQCDVSATVNSKTMYFRPGVGGMLFVVDRRICEKLIIVNGHFTRLGYRTLHMPFRHLRRGPYSQEPLAIFHENAKQIAIDAAATMPQPKTYSGIFPDC